MSRFNVSVRAFAIAAFIIGLIAIYMILSAITTASLRYAHCGPSELAAPEKYCRIAYELLIAGCLVFGISGILAGTAIWLKLKRKN